MANYRLTYEAIIEFNENDLSPNGDGTFWCHVTGDTFDSPEKWVEHMIAHDVQGFGIYTSEATLKEIE